MAIYMKPGEPSEIEAKADRQMPDIAETALGIAARGDAAVRDLSVQRMFVHQHSLTIEWGDCDPAGIVFYPRYFVMFDAATGFLLEAASGMTRTALMRHYGVIGWPMVDTRAIFRETARFDDQVVIESRVTRLGGASFDIEHRLRRGDTVCIEATETRVWAKPTEEPGRIKALPLPDKLRQSLTAHDQ